MALRKGSKVKYKRLVANKPKKKYTWSAGVVKYKYTGGTPRRTIVSVKSSNNNTYILDKKDVKRRKRKLKKMGY